MVNTRVRYYYSFLNPLSKKAFDSIYKQLRELKKDIRVIAGSTEAKKLYSMVLLDCPELFYVDITRMSVMVGVGYTVIQPCYSKNTAEIKALSASLNAIRDRFLLEVSKRKLGNFETVRFVHDFLIKNLVYDFDSLNRRTIIGDGSNICGALLSRKAVCMGIALAVKWLLDGAGIPSGIIEGNAFSVSGEKYSDFKASSDQLNHAWNIVNVNDHWQYMDVTMDLGGSNLKQKWISYDYFMRSDLQIQKYAQFINPYIKCTLEPDSYFSRNKTVFSDEVALKKYLQFCVRNRVKRIYFLAEGDLGTKDSASVQNIVLSYVMGSLQIRCNERLGSFDFLVV